MPQKTGKGNLKEQAKRRWERIKNDPEKHKAYLEKQRNRQRPRKSV